MRFVTTSPLWDDILLSLEADAGVVALIHREYYYIQASEFRAGDIIALIRFAEMQRVPDGIGHDHMVPLPPAPARHRRSGRYHRARRAEAGWPVRPRDSAYPTLRSPASICFKEAKEVLAPGLVAGSSANPACAQHRSCRILTLLSAANYWRGRPLGH
jgi:hypothetical protein